MIRSTATVWMAGCATQPSLEPVTTSEPPVPVHNDILVPLPKGPNWYRRSERTGPLVFGLKPPPEDPQHTFLLAVGYWNKSENDPDTPEALKEEVAKNLEAKNVDRYHSIKWNVTPPYRLQGTDCVSYDIVQEERDNPHFPAGTLLILTEHGFFCRHPYSPGVVQAFYSERFKQGEKSLLNGALKEEAESFLDSIEFTHPP